MPSQPDNQVQDEVRDFMPGLLVITENPPPKLPKLILRLVLMLLLFVLLWSIFGQLDIVATAEGHLMPQSHIKIIQASDAGTVLEILVQEGQAVQQGQILMRMDPHLLEADLRSVKNDYAHCQLQLRRIDAELQGSEMRIAEGDLPALFTQVRQQGWAHRQAYLDALAGEHAMAQKLRHDLQAASEVLNKLESTLPVAQRSAAAFAKLQEQGYISKLMADDKQKEQLEKIQDMHAQAASLDSLRAMLTASDKRQAQITSAYRSDLLAERASIDAQFEKLKEEKNKLEYKSSQLLLRAPQSGMIKDLSTHTPGAVVAPGTVLMSLVPQQEALRAEVMLRNEDIGFVRLGQSVKIKLAAYPFQKYGMLEGVIIHIGPDVFDATEGLHQAPDTSQATARYPVLVNLPAQHLMLAGQPLHLTAGMQVVADIYLGRRSVLEYLLSPVQKAWMEAARER